MTVIIIISFIGILCIGFIVIKRQLRKVANQRHFTNDYRDNFLKLSNKYFSTYDEWVKKGELDGERYIWLTKNVNKMQSELGTFGTIHYMAPFQTYQVNNYQVIINTIPKFRSREIQNLDVQITDDCLIRYIGVIENNMTILEKNLKNPIIWFREGFQILIGLPFYLLNWFGILGDGTVSKLVSNTFFKILTGIGGFIAFVSALVTIIQGKEQTIAFIKSLITK